ncbi:hypothetical protein ACIF6L_34685 [Kitasatospora sp. NPDC086009]|uniref:hypothetical protein n=1 Tax=unclassified Kitasatospora TaxID=2633591 RepID=UPI0037C65BC0
MASTDNLGRRIAVIEQRIDRLERAPRGFAGRTAFSLEATGAGGLNGAATLTGTAGIDDREGSIQFRIRSKDNPAADAMLELSPTSFTLTLADDSRLIYDTVGGVYINSAVKVQGGDLTVGPSANLALGAHSRITTYETWEDITFATGFGNLGDGTPGSWRTVQVRKQADGTVAMRGIATVPSDFISGTIGQLPDGYAPQVPEPFPVSSGDGGVNAFIHPDGRIELISKAPIADGFVSFSRCVWDLD